MFAPQLIQGRWLWVEDLEELQRLMAEHPHWSRRRLSIALCEALNWRTASGQLKDMSARLLLNKLADGTEPLYVDTQALRAWLLSACPSGTKAIQFLTSRHSTLGLTQDFIHDLWAGRKHRSMVRMNTGFQPLLSGCQELNNGLGPCR